jgi:predicted nucleic acid-binding protein
MKGEVVAYVDTSVVLRVVLAEPSPLREWRSIDVAITSELTRVEALRTLDRARIRMRLSDSEIAGRRADVLEVLSSFHFADLDGRVLERAAEPYPTTLGTLDALHLATALLVRRKYPDLSFATHDAELGDAARAQGFRVLGVKS